MGSRTGPWTPSGTAGGGDGLSGWLTTHGWDGTDPGQPLSGGQISTTIRRTRADGASVVVKQAPRASAGMFPAEAAGLAALSAASCVRCPRVLAVTDTYLVLEDLGAARSTPAEWADLGHAVAHQHLIVNDRFGWATDNYLGRLPQHNPWTVDGHAFFAEQRLLRYLPEPPAMAALTPADRGRLERVAADLPTLVPVQPASLLHGDLWSANIIGIPPARDPTGDPPASSAVPPGAAVIDPACYYGWAEADLSMLFCCGGVPDLFFTAYQEIRPLAPGWEDRMPLLHLREHLSVIAHFGDTHGTVHQVRDILDRWTPRPRPT